MAKANKQHTLKFQIVEKFEPFLEPNRYKIAYGGRGSSKSWSIAQLLILKAYKSRSRILCAREIQRSIEDSVIQLLADTIERMGLGAFFDVQKTQIIGRNGSRIFFSGLKSNVTKIKSIEGIDIVWVEEAESVTNASWDTLIPTIRKEGSEIWISFNPLDEFDATYQRFVVNPPPDAYVAKVNWSDNPWFPKELERERVHLQATNPDLYEHVWEGNPFANKDGSYYAKYINLQQITKVPIEKGLLVHSAWDLGVSDSTAIWLWQMVGREIRFVQYYENSGEGLQHYVQWLHEWRVEHDAVFGHHIAPHDIRVRELGSGQSRLETARNLGIEFQIAPSLPLVDGIEATRNLLPNAWFDEDRCGAGLRLLRHYRKEWDDNRQAYKAKPVHDATSHAADAMRYCAISPHLVGQVGGMGASGVTPGRASIFTASGDSLIGY
jgi:phage terminase large subunit